MQLLLTVRKPRLVDATVPPPNKTLLYFSGSPKSFLRSPLLLNFPVFVSSSLQQYFFEHISIISPHRNSSLNKPGVPPQTYHAYHNILSGRSFPCPMPCPKLSWQSLERTCCHTCSTSCRIHSSSVFFPRARYCESASFSISSYQSLSEYVYWEL